MSRRTGAPILADVGVAATEEQLSIRRALGWALVAALTVAAVTGSVALVGGSFDDTEVRVLGTSLGFAVFSATAASGAALRFGASERLRELGLLTVVFSAAAFALLAAALWVDADADALWRAWGCAGLAALAASHASLVLGARRPEDSGAIRSIVGVSVVTAVTGAFLAALAVTGVVEEIDEGAAELMGVLVIALLLTTALPPIMRRLAAPSSADGRPRALAGDGQGAPEHRAGSGPGSAALAADVLAVADRIEELNADPGSRAAEIRRECKRLRQLARAYSP